jgi:hypothetical protein
VESGKLGFSPKEVEPRRALNEVKDVLRPLAEAKKISVIVEVDPNLESVFTDPVRLKQVLYNYLSNAEVRIRNEKGCSYKIPETSLRFFRFAQTTLCAPTMNSPWKRPGSQLCGAGPRRGVLRTSAEAEPQLH